MDLLKQPAFLFCIAIAIAVIGITIWLYNQIKQCTDLDKVIVQHLKAEKNILTVSKRDIETLTEENSNLKESAESLKKKLSDEETKLKYLGACIQNLTMEMKKTNPDFSLPSPPKMKKRNNRNNRRSKKKYEPESDSESESESESETESDSDTESEEIVRKKKKDNKKKRRR